MNILGFSPEQLIAVLQLGFSGVAFVFLLMSFMLLKSEQSRETGPNDKMLRAIRQFSLMSLVFAVLVGGIALVDKSLGTGNTVSAQCEQAISRAKLLSQSPEQTADTLRGLIATTINQCGN
ncbi:MAG: hypothetical protein VXY23_16670 [Pseudomonadota bacterium]|nr:hypothetical protein [Pseudomonadota bacterium]